MIKRQKANKQNVSLNGKIRARLLVYGIVQGVGFRPFVDRFAQENHLTGWVLNSSSGVEVEITSLLARKLEEMKFDFYVHQRLPANDGRISLGQAVIANFKSFNKFSETARLLTYQQFWSLRWQFVIVPFLWA